MSKKKSCPDYWLCESYDRQYEQSHNIDYRPVMPTNLYGLGDNYRPENSHVIPALIGRFHEAKVANAVEVVTWGTGTLRREFLCADDMAAASVFVMDLDKSIYDQDADPMQSHINVGFGSDVTIQALAHAVVKATGYAGKLVFDASKPDGAPRKWMDSGKLNQLGLQANAGLQLSLGLAYQAFLAR